MAKVVRMPRPRPTQEELEPLGTEAIRQYKRSELAWHFLSYGGIVGLIGIWLLADYLLTHT